MSCMIVVHLCISSRRATKRDGKILQKKKKDVAPFLRWSSVPSASKRRSLSFSATLSSLSIVRLSLLKTSLFSVEHVVFKLKTPRLEVFGSSLPRRGVRGFVAP